MIIVFGSLNMDMSIGLPHLPEPGETILSTEYELFPGGKGANQALAVARAGAKVALVGKVGHDNYGKTITESLKRDGVMVSGVGKSDDLPTGTAVIMRNPSGENQIIVLSGANVEVNHDQVPDEILIPQNTLLMQMELPVDQTVALLERAHNQGVKTILNLAPAIMIPKKAIGHIDILIVNSIEARQMATKLNLAVENNALKLAKALAIEGNMICIITLGRKGSIAIGPDGKGWGVSILPMDQKDVVDTTGAGDAYCGTIAACLHVDMPLPEAMRRASVAGSLACLKAGAQDSLPYLDDIESRLAELPEADSLSV
jgi:ribokinase